MGPAPLSDDRKDMIAAVIYCGMLNVEASIVACELDLHKMLQARTKRSARAPGLRDVMLPVRLKVMRSPQNCHQNYIERHEGMRSPDREDDNIVRHTNYLMKFAS